MPERKARPKTPTEGQPKQWGSFPYSHEDVVEALVEEHGEDRLRRGADYVSAPCVHPDHEDENPSMSVSVGPDGRTLVHCHAGCDQREVWNALHALASKQVGRAAPSVSSTSDIALSRECTLAAYAEAKGLPVGFLEGLGLEEKKQSGHRILSIPYSEDVVRYRTALTGENRFRWRSGSKPTLYGLWRLGQMGGEDYIVLVEGESCAQTAWLHDIPALGLPGASTWKNERDAPHLDGFDRIYVVIEPDRGGTAVLAWLEKSSIRDRVHLLHLGDHEDVSDAYLADRDSFEDRFAEALEQATPWHEFEDQALKVVESEAWGRCSDLAGEGRILDRFREDIHGMGVVGEEDIACLLLLALTSRVFSRPVSVVVKGPSSGGKSFVVEQVLSFMPPSAFYSLSAMSERALVYWEEPLEHRFLVLYEAEALSGDFVSYALRSLLSEGELRYVTVESTPEGIAPREILRPGPTGLIVTTTRVAIHPENETRMLSLTVSDTPEQTRGVLLAIARGRDDVDLSRWHALQEWLGARGGTEVDIPLAERLAGLVAPVATRLRRDFTTLLMLIRAHALLHQETRERDSRGRIVATTEDYAVVRELVEHVIAEGLGVSVSHEVAEVVEAVRELLGNDSDERLGSSSEEDHPVLHIDFREGVSTVKVAHHLGLDESTAWRRVQRALRGDYLRNLEARPRVKARLVLGDAQLERGFVLPLPEDLL